MSGLISEFKRVWVRSRFLDLLKEQLVEFGVSVD